MLEEEIQKVHQTYALYMCAATNDSLAIDLQIRKKRADVGFRTTLVLLMAIGPRSP
jgi:hypothetical protein